MPDKITINTNPKIIHVTQQSNKIFISSPGPQGPTGQMVISFIPTISPIINTGSSIAFDQIAQYITLDTRYAKITGSVQYSASSGSAQYATTSGSTLQTDFNSLTISGSSVATQDYVIANVPASAIYSSSAGYSTNSGSSTYSDLSASTFQTNFATLYLAGSAVATQEYVNNASVLFAVLSGSAQYASSAGYASLSGSATNATYATTSGSSDYATNSGSSTYSTNSSSALYATSAGNSNTTSQTDFNPLTISGSSVATQDYVNSQDFQKSTGSVAYATNSGSSVYSTNSGNSQTTSQTSFNNLNVTGSTTSINPSTGALVVGGGTGIGGDLNVFGNINVTGSAFFGGSAIYVSASELVISDPLIYLAEGNVGNVWDIGFVGNFTPSGSAYQHTGLVRDHNDGKWKLFSGVVPEPTNTVDFASATYDTLKLGAIEVSSSAQVDNLNAQYLAGIESASYARLDQAQTFTGTQTFNNFVQAYANQLQSGKMTLGQNTFNNNNMLTVTSNASTNVGIAVKGSASQTANLQEWQNASATILTRVSSDGTIFAPALSISGNAVFNYQTTFQNSGITPLIAKNLGGSANIQEWQNSAGASLTSISASGALISNVGGHRITNSSSATVPLTIVGSSAQNANIFEIRTSSNQVFNLDLNGHAYVSSGRGLFINSGFIGTTRFAVQTSASAEIGAIIRGSASQTANLQEWQSSSGSVLAGVNASGFIYTGSTGPVTNLAGTATGQLSVQGSASNTIPLIVRRPSAGNANTFEVQTSGGQPYVWVDSSMVLNSIAAFNARPSTIDGNSITALPSSFSPNHRGDLFRIADGANTTTRAAFNAIGQIYTGSTQPILTTVSNISSISASGFNASITTTTASNNLSIGQIVYVTGASPNEYNGNFYVNAIVSSSTFTVSKGIAFATSSATTPGTVSLPSQLSIVPSASNVSGISIQGKVGQQGNLLEFRNSSGTVVSNVIYNGDWVVPNLYNGYIGVGTGYSYYAGGSTNLFVVNGAGSKVGAIFRQRSVSSSTDLTQWQTNSASSDFTTGTTVAGVTASGQFYTGASAIVNTTYGTPKASQVFITAPSANVGLYLKSQSSNQFMLAIENQSGTRGFDITADGSIFAAGTFYVGYGSTFGPYGVGSGMRISSTASTAVSLTLRSIASQTADLLQLTNASGTVLSKFDSLGQYTGIYTTLASDSAGTTPLKLKGSVSQTANLQEWQNSSGSVLASINASGQLVTGGMTFITSSVTWTGSATKAVIASFPVISGAESLFEATVKIKQGIPVANPIRISKVIFGTSQSGDSFLSEYSVVDLPTSGDTLPNATVTASFSGTQLYLLAQTNSITTNTFTAFATAYITKLS